MSPPSHRTRRRVLTLLCGGIVLSASPFGLGREGGPFLAPSAAWAGDDEDEDDGGRGRGRGRGRGGDDDEDDRDNDSSGPGSGRDNDDDRSGSDGGDDSDPSGSPSHSGGGASSLRDITVLYPDGWTERIASGRYELIDPDRRLVVARAATGEDFARMIALR